MSDVLVIAKEPVPGRVKTRLCPPLTFVEAAAVAEASLADTLEAAVACGADRVVLVLDGRPGPWCPSGVVIVAQVEGDLARRLSAAWSHASGPSIQIGMDTPQVDAELLAGHLELLGDDPNHAVLGAAIDGGWWLLGLGRADPRAFDGVPMSADDTYVHQRRQLDRLGYVVTDGRTLRDVDHATDLRVVADTTAPGSRFARAVSALGRRAEVLTPT